MKSNPFAPKVVIIVLNWNGKQDTLACLASLKNVTYPSFEVVVVDNGSSDGSAAGLRAAFPQANVIETGENLGFVGGNNLGLEYARGAGADYALLLNNDTEVDPQFLSCMVNAAESSAEIGVVGPSIYYHSAPDVFWSAGGEIDRARGVTRMTGDNQADRGQFGEDARPVDFVTGCALLIRMSVVAKVGMLDPRFFAYYEETEWCVRVARAGYRIVHAPRAKVWHKISQAAREASPSVHYYMTRNRLLFLKLSQAGARAWLLTAVEYARILAAWSLRPKWRQKAAQRRAMLQAICDYRKQKFGKVELVNI